MPSTQSAGSGDCTTRLKNAHRTVWREVLYRFHPWFGRDVFVHAMIERAGSVVFCCTLDGSDTTRWLEIPAWMFDRAVCVHEPCLASEPFVGVEALTALSALLDQAFKTTAPSSNALLSGAFGISHDQNRGESHGVKRQRRRSCVGKTGEAVCSRWICSGRGGGRHERRTIGRTFRRTHGTR